MIWRLLVTGSRKWVDDGAVESELRRFLKFQDDRIVVVHGDCPNGADRIARDFARRHPRATEESHPADWSLRCPRCPGHRRVRNGASYCPAQGPLRNQKMVDLGADACLAFPLGESNGTRDCMARAKKAGIPVHDVSIGRINK